MKSICFVAPVSDNAGGIAVWLNNILSFCKKNNINTYVIDTLPKFRGTKRSFFNRFIRTFLQVNAQCKEFKRIIEKNNQTILHIATSGSYGFYRDLRLLKIAKKMKISTIVHYHYGLLPQVLERKIGLEYILFKRCFKLIDYHIAIDDFTYNSLKKITNFVSFVNNPVEGRTYSFSRLNKKFVFVGRCTKEKGFYELINAFALHKEFLLTIVGEAAKKELKLLDGKTNISFLGKLSHKNTLDVISKSGCLVLPSHTEGMPNVILEAMSFGVPCIGTDVGGIKTMIGNSGIVIKPKDVDNLIKALRTMSNDSVREDFSKTAYSIVRDRFVLEIVGYHLLLIWEKL